MNEHIADALMRRYIALRASRGCVPAIDLAMTGWTSTCCKSPLTKVRGETVCARCHRKCGESEIRAGRNDGKLSNSWQHMYVHETRNTDIDREDRRRSAAAEQWILLESLIALPPEDRTKEAWEFSLFGWEISLDERVRCRTWALTFDVVADIGTVNGWGELWRSDRIGTGIKMCRRVVLARASTQRLPVRVKLRIDVPGGSESDAGEPPEVAERSSIPPEMWPNALGLR
jgi:uncharacterized Zn finger protein (UPF0148 family)